RHRGHVQARVRSDRGRQTRTESCVLDVRVAEEGREVDRGGALGGDRRGREVERARPATRPAAGHTLAQLTASRTRPTPCPAPWPGPDRDASTPASALTRESAPCHARGRRAPWR